jgi:REP element-mobilizing transposase RayT
MVRRPRVEVEGGLYHVYNRVSSGENIFADPNEAIEFVDRIREVKKRDGWTLFAWCVLSDHYHLVVRTARVPLWRGMHSIQNLFSRQFNRRFGRTGSLWQGRYKSKYIEDQRYLDHLILYVHLNPVQAGLVRDPTDYVFGGHREVKKQVRASLVDIDEMLLCFGPTRKAARRAYLSAIRAGIEPNGNDLGVSWHPFAAAGDSPLEVNQEAPYIDVLWRSTGLERPTLAAGRFVELVCKMAGLDMARLASRARDRETAAMRRLVVTLGVERWRQRGTALAEVLNKNPDVVSWWVGEGVRRRVEDDDFANELDRLDEMLAAALAREPATLGNENGTETDFPTS